jgi:hypothetical protein
VIDVRELLALIEGLLRPDALVLIETVGDVDCDAVGTVVYE